MKYKIMDDAEYHFLKYYDTSENELSVLFEFNQEHWKIQFQARGFLRGLYMCKAESSGMHNFVILGSITTKVVLD